MKKISREDLRTLVEFQQESIDVELKSAFEWTNRNTIESLRLIRAILAMNNTRGGGKIILGVKQKPEPPTIEGMTKKQIESFEDLESVTRTVNKYSSAPIKLDITSGPYAIGEDLDVELLVITVREFDRVPALCVKGAQVKVEGKEKPVSVLEERAIYVRTEHQGIASDKLSSYEIDDLIALCVSKGVRRQNEDDWVHSAQIRKVLKRSPEAPSMSPLVNLIAVEQYFLKNDKDLTS